VFGYERLASAESVNTALGYSRSKKNAVGAAGRDVLDVLDRTDVEIADFRIEKRAIAEDDVLDLNGNAIGPFRVVAQVTVQCKPSGECDHDVDEARVRQSRHR